MTVSYSPGENIAVKVPSHEYEATVEFYKSVLGLSERDVSAAPDSVAFAFGDKTLWVDRVAGLSQAETWLEIRASDVDAARRQLEDRGCVLRDDIETLPPGFDGFWLSSPANTIHLVSGSG